MDRKEHGLDGSFTVTNKEDFKPESVDIVVCGYARPDAFRTEVAKDVEMELAIRMAGTGISHQAGEETTEIQ